MSALTMQAVHDMLEPANRRVAFHHAIRIAPEWMEHTDLEQVGWEVCGELAQTYTPREGIPAAHYVTAAFPWLLYRRVKQAGTRGRSVRTYVYSRPHAFIRADTEQVPEATDYALTIACAELLQALPALERQALWLCAVEGLSFTRAAAQMGVPRSTAFVLYKRAVAAARTFWDEAAA